MLKWGIIFILGIIGFILIAMSISMFMTDMNYAVTFIVTILCFTVLSIVIYRVYHLLKRKK